MHEGLAFWVLIVSVSLTLRHLIPPSKAENGVVTTELWCVAKNNAEDAALQAAVDWACGQGGADCSPIQQDGPCYDPSDVQNTASYAFNDYFLKHGMTEESCSFGNTAALTSLNPSHDKCKFPSSLSVRNASIASQSTASGMGPSENMNGSDRISQQWIITSLLIIAFAYVHGW